ncbi:MAG: hypothetical protein FJ148_10550 [Deltaproteobacteria bacterium]|nr:hypothetical protein [Deltaproteobacteria bacterium]
MPPEASLLERSRGALASWIELRAAYDAIDDALADPARADLGALASRVVALENDLKPRIADLSAARSTTVAPASAIVDVWQEIDAVVGSLATRQPQLVRAALAARAATAERLDDLRATRGHLRRYAGEAPREAVFTSRCA